MGVGELIANVVFGIASALVVAATTGSCAAEIAGDACDAAALAACSFTAREIASTVSTGRNTMIQRVFMEQTSIRCGNESYRRLPMAAIRQASMMGRHRAPCKVKSQHPERLNPLDPCKAQAHNPNETILSVRLIDELLQ